MEVMRSSLKMLRGGKNRHIKITHTDIDTDRLTRERERDIGRQVLLL